MFAAYDILDVLDETGRPPQFFVRVRDGLGARIRMHRGGGFGVVRIGAPDRCGDAAD